MTQPSVDLALASLRVWAVEVELAGTVYRIPPRPAAEWMAAVLSGEPCPVVPGMLEPADQEDVIDALLEGRVKLADVEAANRDALSAASGWKWYEAERLIVSAGVEWRVVGGLLQGAGLDLSTCSLGAALSAMYAMAVTHMKKEDRFSFDAQLTAPPPGARATEYVESDYADAFAELLRAHQQPLPGGGKAPGE